MQHLCTTCQFWHLHADKSLQTELITKILVVWVVEINNIATCITNSAVDYMHWNYCLFKHSSSAWRQYGCFMLPVESDPPQPSVDPTLGCLQWKYHRSLQFLQDLCCLVKQGFSHSYSNNSSQLRTSSVTQVAGSSFLSHHHFKCVAWCSRRSRPAMTVLEKPS